jgi:glycosyltransferase involved in cell wall biosynthesis
MLGLLYYGRLEKEKGFDSLLEAIKILQDKNVSFEIFIFGSGSLESELLPLTGKNVHFF